MLYQLLRLGFNLYLSDQTVNGSGQYNPEENSLLQGTSFLSFLTNNTNLNVSLFTSELANLSIANNIFSLNTDLNNSDKLNEEEIAKELLELMNKDNRFVEMLDKNGDKKIDLEEAAQYSDEADKNNPFKAAQDDQFGQGSLMVSLLNELMQDETFKKAMDINGDGNVDQDEANNFFIQIAGTDGNNKDISINDLMVKLGTMKDSGLTDSQFPENGLIQPADVSFDSHTGSSPLSKANTHSTNYTGPTGTIGTTDKAYNDEKNSKIKQNNQKIKELNDKKAEICSSIPKYNENIKTLNTINDSMAESQIKLNNLETEKQPIAYDLKAAEAELANLTAPVIFTDELQEEYEKTKASLEQQVADLTKNLEDKQKEIDEEKKNYDSLEREKKSTEAEIKELEQKYPQSGIEQINGEIKSLEAENDKIIKEMENDRKKELEDAQVYGKCKAFRESELVKTLLDACVDPNTKKQWDDWYYNNFNGKAYCGVFLCEMIEGSVYEKIMDKYGFDKKQLVSMLAAAGDKGKGVGVTNFSTSPDSFGYNIQSALNKSGINVNGTVDVTKMSAQERKDAVRNGLIYPGMAFTYQENGRFHVGYIESINKDLSWNTIEGNTSIKYDDGSYEQHTVGSHVRDASNPDLSTVTDPFSSWYVLFKNMGIDIDGLIYSNYA